MALTVTRGYHTKVTRGTGLREVNQLNHERQPNHNVMTTKLKLLFQTRMPCNIVLTKVYGFCVCGFKYPKRRYSKILSNLMCLFPEYDRIYALDLIIVISVFSIGVKLLTLKSHFVHVSRAQEYVFL